MLLPPSLTLAIRLHFSPSQVVPHLHWLPSGRDGRDTSLHKLKLLVLFRPFFLASPPFSPISFRKTSESSLSPLDAGQYLACTSPIFPKEMLSHVSSPSSASDTCTNIVCQGSSVPKSKSSHLPALNHLPVCLSLFHALASIHASQIYRLAGSVVNTAMS